MSTTGSASRRAGLIVAAAGLAAGTLLAAPAAQAARSTDAATAGSAAVRSDTATVAATLASRLGSRTAGSYLDRTTGRLVVTVTDSAAAQTVRAAGATPRTVARSAAQLRGVMATLDRSLRVPGTAWGVDPAANQVVLSVDSSVVGAKLDRVRAVAARLGAAVRLESVAGTFRTRISGGDAIYSGGYRCSLGFNVRSSSGTYYFLTAGHCGNIGTNWYSNSSRTNLIGYRAGSSFPGNDYAIIQYTGSVSHPGNVDLYNGSTQDITRAANAYVGEPVRRSGSTTHVHSGYVQQLNVTVTYSDGSRVSGLIRTNVCAEGGDSGGSLFDGSTAVGLTSGGSGNCTFGGTTFFQPVTEPLSVYGVSVY